MNTLRTISMMAQFILTLGGTSARAQDIQDTRLLSQPAVSADQIAFEYAGDLWVASLEGSDVRRLTSHVGTEASPRFSLLWYSS